MNICVFGAASTTIDAKYVTAAEELGRAMASRGHKLVFGGGATGCMGGVGRGVNELGGEITGIVPEFFRSEGLSLLYDNIHMIYTEDMSSRKKLMEDMSDAFIICPGGIGTYEEFLEVITLKQLGRHQKPIVILNIEGFYDRLVGALNYAADEHFIENDLSSLYSICSTPEEAVRLCE